MKHKGYHSEPFFHLFIYLKIDQWLIHKILHIITFLHQFDVNKSLIGVYSTQALISVSTSIWYPSPNVSISNLKQSQPNPEPTTHTLDIHPLFPQQWTSHCNRRWAASAYTASRTQPTRSMQWSRSRLSSASTCTRKYRTLSVLVSVTVLGNRLIF